MSTPPEKGPRLTRTGSLHHLLKHAQMRLAELTGPALDPFGIDGRECAVLLAVNEAVAESQQQIAERMGVDRTTMVTLIDGLEVKGLVERHPDPGDRRRNVVVLTPVGHATLEGATRAVHEAERRFLAELSGDEAAAFRETLRKTAFGAAAPAQ